MNFWKSSKRPLTPPPHFRKVMLQKSCRKSWIKKMLPRASLVKGRLELFRKFIRFGVVRLPLPAQQPLTRERNFILYLWYVCLSLKEMRYGTVSHDSVCDINPLKFRTGQKEMKPFFSKVCHTHRIHKMRNNDRTTLWVPFLFHHYPPEWHLICPNTSLTSWTTYSSIPGHFEFHRKWNWLNSTKKTD